MNKALQRGQHRSIIVQSGQVECVAWKNSKVVTMINTISNPSSPTHVKRKSKDGQLKQVPCPESGDAAEEAKVKQRHCWCCLSVAKRNLLDSPDRAAY